MRNEIASVETVGGYAIIRIHKSVLPFPVLVELLLLHEMAHLSAGIEAGHGRKWKMKVRQLMRRGAYDRLL